MKSNEVILMSEAQKNAVEMCKKQAREKGLILREERVDENGRVILSYVEPGVS